MRMLLLTLHVVLSLGWFGAAAAVLALGIVGLTTADAALADAVYRATGVVWRGVIVPFSLGALVTGVVQGLVGPWGLVRHFWVLAKLVITVAAVLLLLLHTGSLLPALTGAVVEHAHGHAGLPPRIHLVVAAGGTLLLLLVAAILSVWKPWGRTGFGRRP
jgi:hypothetical protein